LAPGKANPADATRNGIPALMCRATRA
jgi:hypothetical protein